MLNEIMSDREKFMEILAKCIFDNQQKMLRKMGRHSPDECTAGLVFQDMSGERIPVMCPRCDPRIIDWDDNNNDPNGLVVFAREYAAGIVRSMEELAINGIIND